MPIDGAAETIPVPSTSPTGSLSLDQLGGDVWAWTKSIAGTCHGLDPDAMIDVTVNGAHHPAEREGDRFGATVPLDPGDNAVQAVATLGQVTVESDRVIHTVRLSPRPTTRISLSLTEAGMVLDGSGSEPGGFDGAPIRGYAWSLRPNGPASSRALPLGSQTGSSKPVPEADGEYAVTLTISNALGRRDAASAFFVVERGQARIVDPAKDRAAWTEGATVYGIVVRNVGPDGYQSVIDRLDDLADLGIAAIWLAPINATITGDFGYSVIDYFGLRPEYGTRADFKRFVQEAHARNLRVLMDVVPNHTSSEHPYYRDAERNGAASPYFTFYERDGEGEATHYFSWTHLPNLNFDNPDVRRFMTEALLYWVRELDIDGFRIDVAWGIKQRRPDFWPEFSAEFHRVKPDGLLIAEASARDPYYVNNGFDSAYDWTDELGVWAWADVFSGETPIPTAIARAFANRAGGGYEPDSFVFRFLNNNDTGPRFISTHGVDLYRVASAMLLTLPGLPCVYTGDEVGAEFEPYANQGPIDWTDRFGLRSHFRKLIHLRRTLPGIMSNYWTAFDLEPADQVFGYVRHDVAGASPVLVLLNFGPDATDASIDPGDLPAALGGSTSLADLYNETSVVLNRLAMDTCRGDESAMTVTPSASEGSPRAAPAIAHPAQPVSMPLPAAPTSSSSASHRDVSLALDMTAGRQFEPGSDAADTLLTAGPHRFTIPVGPWGIRVLVPEGTRR